MATSRAFILSSLISMAALVLPLGVKAAPSSAPTGPFSYRRCAHTLRFELGVRLLADADTQIHAANYPLADDLLDGGHVAVRDQIFDAREAKQALVLDNSLNHVLLTANARYAHDPHRDTLVKRALLADDISRCQAEDHRPHK